jgi:L-asparaginase
VVTATRTGAGRVVAIGEGGRVTAVPGTLAAEDLTPIKARILLMLALTRTTDTHELQRMFREY